MARVFKSLSQTATHTAHGTLDQDVSDIITNISPDKTPFLSTFKKAENATELEYSWFLDELQPPRLNAHREMEDYKSEHVQGLTRMSNTIQRFRRSAVVSDDMQKVKKLYTPGDEMARQMTIKAKELARDMELAIVQNSISRLDRGPAPALTGGIPYFMREDTIDITIAGDEITIVEVPPFITTHGLTTGDFVIFKPKTDADALPPEIEAGERYYVRLSPDPDMATKTFTIFANLEDAVSGRNQIALSGPGTGTLQILKNNIIDCGNQPYTANDIDKAMELLYYRGGNATEIYMSGRNKRRFTEAMNLVHVVHRDHGSNKVSNNTTVYEGSFGTVTAHSHHMYRDDVIDILDMSMWNLKYFDNPRVITLPIRGDYTEKVIKASFGLKGTQPLASARLINVGKSV